MRLAPLILFALAFSCASRQGEADKAQVVDKAEGYTSPNQKIEVEILVQKTEKSNPKASFSKGVFKAGAIVPSHAHEGSDEYLSFVRGAGELTIEGETYFVQDGQSFYIPRGVEHSYVNRSGKDATFFQVYTPGGPEQRFKKWSVLKGP